MVILLYLPPPPHQLVGVSVVDVGSPPPLVVIHALGHVLVPLSVGLREGMLDGSQENESEVTCEM